MHRVRGVVAALLIVAIATQPAAASSAPSLTLTPDGGMPGDEVVATGAGFQPGMIGLYLDVVVPGTELGTVEVPPRGDGTFGVRFLVPRTGEGSHQLIACRDVNDRGECRETAAAALRVTAPPSTTSPTTTARPPDATRPPATIPPVIVAPTTPAPTTTVQAIVPIATAPPSPPPTVPAVVATETTAPGVATIAPDVAASIPDGPDPTFDPTPGGLAVTTTAAPLDEHTNIPVGDFPDLFVQAIEVTQGIQDLQMRMPLVADRRTTVRVHPGVDPDDEPWAPIDGLLLVQRAGQEDLVLLPTNGGIATGHDRTEMGAALNFDLPADQTVAGSTTLTALVWSYEFESVATEEPDAANNQASISVTFHAGENPTVWLAALDDGAGPGPDVNDLTPLLGFALVVNQDLLDYHPVSAVDFQLYPEPVQPGPEAAVTGLWDLSLDMDDDATADARRHEPNIRLSWLAELAGILDEGDVLGYFDESIPSGGYTGWAGWDVAWNKPVAGTPAHELGHMRDLQHVGCKDEDGDGFPDEAKGGAVDPTHPMGLPPQCSLAPISPTGYFGYTNYRTPVSIYSNDPTHPQAAFPFMSYKAPGWTDPYHWCLLLQDSGIDCSPALIGVPPKVILPAADCTPEPGDQAGLQLDLCLVDQLPPDEPFAGSVDGEQVWDGTPHAPMTGEVAMETLTLANETITFVVPLDPDSWLLASGSIDLGSRQGVITQAATVEQPTATTIAGFEHTLEQVAAGVLPATVALRLVDAAGTPLVSVPVDLDGAGHGGGGERGVTEGFFAPVPWAEGAAALELVIDGHPVASRPISAAGPRVTAVAVDAGAGATVISWTVDDADTAADAITATVLWSADGDTWLPVALDVGGTSVTLPAGARFPGGDDVRIRVIANDGVRTGAAASDPFTASTHPPLVTIGGAPAQAVERYELVELHALATDPEDGALDGDALSWSSSLDGPLAGERTLSSRDLSIGEHTITVTAIDGDGNQVQASSTVTVVERTSPTRYTEAPDGSALQRLTGSVTPPAPNGPNGTVASGQPAGAGASPAAAAGDRGGHADGASPAAAVIIVALVAVLLTGGLAAFAISSRRVRIR